MGRPPARALASGIGVPEVVFDERAADDLREARDWYEHEAPNLLPDFVDSLDRTIARLGDNPLQFPRVMGSVRRALVGTAPYSLYLRSATSVVQVIAFLHASRNPKVWRRRVREVTNPS